MVISESQGPGSVFKGPAFIIGGLVLPIVKLRTSLGRYDGRSDVIPDIDLDALDPSRSVSRRHARVHSREGELWLEDAGSTNGTKVNGTRIASKGEVRLMDGDEVTFGKVAGSFSSAVEWPPGVLPEWEVDSLILRAAAARGGGVTPPAPERERILATVLFTDIADSTARAVTLGDRRWAELLDRHDQVMREVLKEYRGRPIKTLGDGFLATFDSPGRAVHCVTAMRRALRAVGLEIRAGLHTGECEVMGADDIGGIAVHIAARVAARAEGGQTLVSSTVKDLVAGSELSFRDMGVRKLKGIPTSWRLFAFEE